MECAIKTLVGSDSHTTQHSTVHTKTNSDDIIIPEGSDTPRTLPTKSLEIFIEIQKSLLKSTF